MTPFASWFCFMYRDQRRCLAGSSLFFGFIFIAAAWGGAAEPEETRPPNFVFILSDDVAQGDLGSYGQTKIRTPRLDEMAAGGTRYMQAYCGTSVCAPSRASFFTGLHTGHCPIRGNYEVPPEGQWPLPEDVVTIAEVAQDAGYATGTFGKWGMGFFGTSGDPMNQGVQRFFGYNCQRHAHSYFPTYLFSNRTAFRLEGNNGRDVGQTYAQALIQDAMIDWVNANADRPFFLFYAVTLPHGRHEIDDLGIYAKEPWTDKQKAYAAQITRLDSDVGQLVDTLRAAGVEENTCIVFSGDNGSSFSPDSEIGSLFDQAANGLRGYKRGMYEGALRQAALSYWPGTIPAGRVSHEPWAFWDLMPTFVEMSSATKPANYRTDGRSLWSFFRGGPAPSRPYFYWELHLTKPIRAARFEDWKAVQNRIGRPIEIYDLKTDPGEQNDLAGERPDLVRRARAIFNEAHEPDPAWPLDGHSEAHRQTAKAAWELTRKRVRETYVPEQSVALEEAVSR